MEIVTIIEHTVRQYEIIDEEALADFDPWDAATYIRELEVSAKLQNSLTDGWEFVNV